MPTPTDIDPSAPWPPRAPSPSHSDFMRLEERIGARMERQQERTEAKLDEISAAMVQMAALQAEVVHQNRRVDHLERRADDQSAKERAQDERMAQTERKLDQWVNRGMGAWAVAVILVVGAWNVFKHFTPR